MTEYTKAEVEHWESEGGNLIAALAIRERRRPVWHKDGE
jgi:hypothetical protein